MRLLGSHGVIESIPRYLYGTARQRTSVIQVLPPGVSEKALVDPLEDLETYKRDTLLIAGNALDFCYLPDDTIAITGFSGAAAYLEVPDHIDGLPVTQIAPRAFSYSADLSEIKLPDSIVRIGRFAFVGSGLRYFSAPENLELLDEKAFFRCLNLTHVKLNDRLLAIGVSAFEKTSLEELVIPASVTSVGFRAFAETSLVVSGRNSTLAIAPGNVRIVLDEYGGLYECRDGGFALLEQLDEEIDEFRVLPGTYRICKGACSYRHNLTKVVLPEGLRFIADNSFRGCEALTAVNLPQSLESIGVFGFDGTSIESLEIPRALSFLGIGALRTSRVGFPARPQTLHDLTVHPENETFYMEDGLLCRRSSELDQGDTAVLYAGTGPEVAIPFAVTTIGEMAFSGTDNIRVLRLHTGIKEIEQGGLSFYGGLGRVYLTDITGQHAAHVAYFSIQSSAWPLARVAFSKGYIDEEFMYSLADRSLLMSTDDFECSMCYILRLKNPHLMDDFTHKRMFEWLQQNCKAACLMYAQDGYSQGFDILADLDIINQGNIEELVDFLSAKHEIAAVNYLLNLKHKRFARMVFDFDI